VLFNVEVNTINYHFRSIRTSERRIWQQIKDIFAECSIDYDKNSEITHGFYEMIKNKFHYAIAENTASEIIYQKVIVLLIKSIFISNLICVDK